MTSPKITKAVVDLADLDTGVASDKGAEIELLHPTTNAPLGLFFSIIGKDSQEFREQLRSDVNARLRREALAQRRGKQIEPPTAEEGEAKAIEMLVLCTKGWRDGEGSMITYKGQKLPFNIANAKLIYTESIWIRRQIDEAIGDLENFMQS